MRLPFLFLALLFLGGCISREEALRPVIVNLKWLHQAQFAGIYAAEGRGYYRNGGLNVTIIPFSYGQDPILEVAEGRAQFGVGGVEEVLKAREQGLPVKAIAVVFKRNPVVIYTTDPRILTPWDLSGKTVGVEPGVNTDVLVQAMLRKLSIGNITLVPIGYDETELLEGKVDASTGYVINEPQSAIEKGYPVNLIYVSDYGFEIYADVIYTSDRLIYEEPELVASFLSSTLDGWEFAIENQEAAVNLTLRYSGGSRAHQDKMLFAAYPLISTGDDFLGMMKDHEWRKAYSVLSDSGVLGGSIDYRDAYTLKFLHDIYGDSR